MRDIYAWRRAAIISLSIPLASVMGVGVVGAAAGTFDNLTVTGTSLLYGDLTVTKGQTLAVGGGSTLYDNGDFHLNTDDVMYLNAPSLVKVQNDLSVTQRMILSNNGWDTGSALYDNGNLHVKTDDVLYLDATSVSASGGLTVANGLTVTSGTLSLPSGSVTSGMLADGTVVAADLATGSVTTTTILDSTIASADIAADTIVAGDIATDAVATAEILDGTILTGDISADTILAADIATGAVATAEILDGTILTGDISADTILAADIATGAVETTEILDDTIASADIAADTIVAGDIATGAIANGEILDGTIIAADFSAGAVDTTAILDSTILTGDITDNTLLADDIATGAVTTDEILNATIVGGDLAANIAITTTGASALNGGITVDTTNFIVDGTTGQTTSASYFTGLSYYSSGGAFDGTSAGTILHIGESLNSYVAIGSATNNTTVVGDLTVTGGEVYVTPIASSASTTEGTVYYDSTDDNLYVYANGSFVDLTAGAAGAATLDDGYNASAGASTVLVDNGDLTLQSNAGATGDIIVNLASTGDFVLQDNGTDVVTFSDAGNLTMASGTLALNNDVVTSDGDLAVTGATGANLTATLNDLDLTAAAGSVIVTAAEDAADAIQITASAGGIDITSTGEAGQDIDVLSTGGSVNVTATEAAGNAIRLNASNAAGGIDVDAGTGTVDVLQTGAIAGNGIILATTDAGVAISAVGAANGDMTLTVGDDYVANVTGIWDNNVTGDATIDAAGVSIDGTAASNFTTSAGALTLNGGEGVNVVGNATEVDVTTTGALDLNSGAGTWDASTLSLDGTDSTNLTMTANAAGDKSLVIASSNAGAGTGLVDVDADGAITVDSSAAGISLDAAAASNFTTSAGALTLNGAEGVNVAGNAAEVDVTTTGALDLNSAAGTWDSSAGISIDGATASNLTVTGAGEDLTLSSVGGSVILSATESAATAVQITSTLGGIDITTTTSTAGEDIDIAAGGSSVNISATENVTDAITLTASAGGINIAATGAATEDITLVNTGGSIGLSATEAASDAINIDATAGGVDIDADAASAFNTTNDELTIGTGTADLVLSGNADGTAAMTVTAGDVTLSDGDLTVAGGDLNVTLDTADGVTIGSTASTATTGIVDMNVTAGDAAVDGLNIGLTQNDGASAGVNATAAEILLTGNDADGDMFGLTITGAATANATTATYEAGISIDNAEDTAGSMTDGILITSSGVNAGVTDAIDASAANITNAINIGANVILGTTGDINLDNFDVTGASGNTTTAGDLAVNGDNIDADGTLVVTGATGLTLAATAGNSALTGATDASVTGTAGDVTLTSGDDILLNPTDDITATILAGGIVKIDSADSASDVVTLTFEDSVVDATHALAGTAYAANTTKFSVDTDGDTSIGGKVVLGRQSATLADDGLGAKTVTATASYVEVTSSAATADAQSDNQFSLAAGTEGQVVILVSIDEADTNSPKLIEGATGKYAGATQTLTDDDSMMLVYTGGNWVQVSALVANTD